MKNHQQHGGAAESVKKTSSNFLDVDKDESLQGPHAYHCATANVAANPKDVMVSVGRGGDADCKY